ncbi:unnamed protein product [Trichogramma brassicae]|uniref:Uncharacterized protein n=1 Tax=Trichogramma brassicae TaxID=86971 RepID=A0A6H5IZ12_9HYME|nr:unnamed protein product [Trichogramma brassicae]
MIFEKIDVLELPSGPEDHPGPPMMRILQLNLNHCEAAQDLLCDTISKLRIDVAILCEQYKNLAPPNTWLADSDGQAAIWVNRGIPVQERPAGVNPYFASRTPGLPPGPRRARAADETPVHSMRTVSPPPCPAHRSIPGPRKIWRRASCPSSPAHVNPRCQGKSSPVVNRCTGGRPTSLISGALACGLADSSRNCGAGMTKKPTARTAPKQGVFCAWRSRPANVGAGGSFATRPSSPAPLSWCAARWWLCFRGCRATAASSGGAYTGRRLGRTQRSSVEDKGALRARSGWHTQLSAQDCCCRASRHLLAVYTTCLETGVFPSSWKRHRLVLLPKPGKPPDEPSSYRPLCMLDTAGKILERIMSDRLEAFTERPGGLSERQYGFRKGRSTIDAIEDVISTAREAIAGKRWYRVVLRRGDTQREECVQLGSVGQYPRRSTPFARTRLLAENNRQLLLGKSVRLHHGRRSRVLRSHSRSPTGEKRENHQHHGRRPQHTLVPLHPLPGPAHRRQAKVRPPSLNSQRKGGVWCPCEDHAQHWQAQKQPTQAVCSRRRLHTPVRSPRLEHSSTKASLHSTGGVSPATSLPACDRRPAACRLRGHICPCRHTTAGPSRGRASAALRPPPRGRKG